MVGTTMNKRVLLLLALALGGCTAFAGADVPEDSPRKLSKGGSGGAGGGGGTGGDGAGAAPRAAPPGRGDYPEFPDRAGPQAQGRSSGGGPGGGGTGGGAPLGWQGPFRVAQASLGSEPSNFADCGGKQGELYVEGLEGLPACSPCACGIMEGGSCIHGPVEVAPSRARSRGRRCGCARDRRGQESSAASWALPARPARKGGLSAGR